ncbi:protealysin inhibitor emfourin [Actinoplanes sp. NPDC051475]|uniref:protealysin inhibitor emfourin n=1 Tax=Actinoplanes sp. NPDC051475 TaxID=3157225 RepID=UPI00344B495F
MTTIVRTINRGMLATTTILAATVGLAATAGAATAAPHPTAAQVTLSETGGFAGVHNRYVVDATTTHVDTPELVRLASTQRFQRLDATYPASTPGADRFAYTVTVRYNDGTTKAVATVEGADAPTVLWRTIDLTRQISLDVTGTPAC